MSFQERAFCNCGFSIEPSFGDIWFVQQRHPVCPECGEDSSEWTMHTVRWVRRGWFKGGYWADMDGNAVPPNINDATPPSTGGQ